MTNNDHIDALVGVFEMCDPDEHVDLGHLYLFAEATYKAGWTPPGPDPDTDPTDRTGQQTVATSDETPTTATTLAALAWRLCHQYPTLTHDQASAAVRLATELTTPAAR